MFMVYRRISKVKDIELIKNYRLLDKELAMYSDMLKSERDYETDIFIPDITSKNCYENKLKNLKNKVNNIDSSDSVYDLLKGHYMDFISGQEIMLETLYTRPMKHVHVFLSTFKDIIRKDSRPDKEKAEILLKRYMEADNMWENIKPWLPDVSELYLKEFIDTCNLFINCMAEEAYYLPEYLPNLNDTQLNEITSSIKTLSGKMDQWIQYVGLLMSNKAMTGINGTSKNDTVQFEEAYYRSILDNELGVNLDELLMWQDDEVEKTRNEIFEIASKIKMSAPAPKNIKDVNNILLKYAGPCNNADEMFKKAREYIKRTKAACRDYVKLPDDENCKIVRIPEQFKFSHPWGGYDVGCRNRRPILGQMFLNNYNFKAITDGWIKMNTVHEAYPGHHVQFVRTVLDTIPETMKIGAKLIPLLEGTAHRSERVFEFIFEEDPFYPLFVAYRRHHTSVRIKVDLMMRYFGNTINDAVQVYIDKLGLDPNTARGQVKSQEFMQGYFTCYYYGMKKICDWEKLYGFDEKTYTELLFSVGKISLTSFEKVLKLDDNDKHRLVNDFPSMIQFG